MVWCAVDGKATETVCYFVRGSHLWVWNVSKIMKMTTVVQVFHNTICIGVIAYEATDIYADNSKYGSLFTDKCRHDLLIPFSTISMA